MRDASARAALRTALDGVRDIERLGGKAAAGRATPRELAALGASLARLPDGRARGAPAGHGGCHRGESMTRWDACAELATQVLDDAGGAATRCSSATRRRSRLASIAELDELRTLRDGGKDAIARIQAEERARTGIGSLKVGYNKVFGYFIEISEREPPSRAGGLSATPDADRRRSDTSRRRSRSTRRRSSRRPSGSRRASASCSTTLRGAIGRGDRPHPVRGANPGGARRARRTGGRGRARGLRASDDHRRLRPRDRGGRHPVVERMMPRDKFIPNDVGLTDDARLVILTGPNMAGKTHAPPAGGADRAAGAGRELRAGVGRARSASCDRVFTRVGASDNLVRGQSTFMVEMAETSAILHTRDAPQPRAAGRDRPRHEHVRRRVDRVGGERAPARRRGLQDDLRHALPRAHAARGRIRSSAKL